MIIAPLLGESEDLAADALCSPDPNGLEIRSLLSVPAHFVARSTLLKHQPPTGFDRRDKLHSRSYLSRCILVRNFKRHKVVY